MADSNRMEVAVDNEDASADNTLGLTAPSKGTSLHLIAHASSSIKSSNEELTFPGGLSYSGSAGIAVSDTFELLENILSYLPLADLTRGHRVCTQWRGVMSKSKKLAEVMFLSAVAPSIHLLWDPKDQPCLSYVAGPDRQAIVEVHPWIRDLQSDEIESMFMEFNGEAFAVSVPSAWAKMFITQPPVHEVIVGFICKSGESEWLLFTDDKGLQLGDFLVKVQKQVAVIQSRGSGDDRDGIEGFLLRLGDLDGESMGTIPMQSSWVKIVEARLA